MRTPPTLSCLSLPACMQTDAVTIAVVSSTLCSYVIEIAADAVLRIELPAAFGPSCELRGPAAGDARGSACLAPMPHSGTTSVEPAAAVLGEPTPRPWLVDVGALLTAGPLLWLTALAAAVPISFFFFFDQNISTLFCQRAPGGLGACVPDSAENRAETSDIGLRVLA